MATAAFVVAASAAARAQSGPPVLRLVRIIEADDIGAPDLVGLPFPPGTDLRLVLDTPSVGEASIVLPDAGEPAKAPRLKIAIPNAINLGFTGRANESVRLFLLDATRQKLVQIEVGAAGPRVQRFDASAYGVDDPRGVAVDPTSDRVFILDAARQKLVRLDGGDRLGERRPGEGISEIAVPRGLSGLRGIAINPADGHLHLYSPSARELYELDGAGRLLVLRALPARDGMVADRHFCHERTDRFGTCPARTELRRRQLVLGRRQPRAGHRCLRLQPAQPRLGRHRLPAVVRQALDERLRSQRDVAL
jgi:hypothetical protein